MCYRLTENSKKFTNYFKIHRLLGLAFVGGVAMFSSAYAATTAYGDTTVDYSTESAAAPVGNGYKNSSSKAVNDRFFSKENMVFDFGDSKKINYSRPIINIKLGYGLYSSDSYKENLFKTKTLRSNVVHFVGLAGDSSSLTGSISANPFYKSKILKNLYVGVYTAVTQTNLYHEARITPAADYHLVLWLNPKKNLTRVELYGGGGVGLADNSYNDEKVNFVKHLSNYDSMSLNLMVNVGAQMVYKHFIVFSEYQKNYTRLKFNIVDAGDKLFNERGVDTVLFGIGLSV